MKSKKGIMNWMAIVIGLFIVSLIFLATTFFFNQMKGSLEEQFTDETTTIILESGERSISAFDIGFGVLFLIIGFVVIMGGSSLIAVSKAFIPIFLILFFILIVLAVNFSNAYEGLITSSPEMAETAEDFPVMTFVMSKLPLFVGIVALALFVITYGKTRGQQVRTV